jgi:hypothetical protein
MNSEERDIIRLFKDILDDEMVKLMEDMDFEEIEIDEAQKNRMKKNVMSRVKAKPSRMKHGLIAAGIAGAILLSALSSPGQRALAEIAKKLHFIPGAGRIVETEAHDIYILQKPIQYFAEETDITINSVTLDGYLTIRASGTGNYQGSKISIVDERGKSYTNNMGSVGSGNGWSGWFSFDNIPENLTSFKIILPGNIEIPITLTKAESFDDYANMGPTDVKNEVGITLVTTKVDDKVKFDLIQHNLKDKEIYLYGKRSQDGHYHTNINVNYHKGNSIKVEHPESYMGTLSEFYFIPSKDASKYTVEIPEVSLKYMVDNEIILPIPESEGEMYIDKSTNMHGFNLRFTRVVRTGNLVRVYVDTGYDKNAVENLSEARLDMPALSLEMYRAPLKENITVDFYELEVKPGQKELKLKFNEMYTVMKGPWSFELTGE